MPMPSMPGVAVAIRVRQRRVNPKRVKVYYTHRRGSGNPSKPNSVEWWVTGLRRGERVDIELREIATGRRAPRRGSAMPAVFHDANRAGTPRWSWSIRSGTRSVDSGRAYLRTAVGPLKIRYEVRLTDAMGRTEVLDPVIWVEPDP